MIETFMLTGENIPQLARESGISQETLQEAFQEAYDQQEACFIRIPGRK